MSAVTPGNPADQSEVSIALPLRQSQLTVVVVRGVEGVLLRGGVVARRGDVPLERPVHAAPIRSQYCGQVTNPITAEYCGSRPMRAHLQVPAL